jgi:hypothetical protein
MEEITDVLLEICSYEDEDTVVVVKKVGMKGDTEIFNHGGEDTDMVLEIFSRGELHCKSGSHKNGIRKSSRKRYNHIMGI